MSSAIRLICPNLRCRSLLCVPATARGKTVRCGQCGGRISVPQKAAVKPRDPQRDEDSPVTNATDAEE